MNFGLIWPKSTIALLKFNPKTFSNSEIALNSGFNFSVATSTFGGLTNTGILTSLYLLGCFIYFIKLCSSFINYVLLSHFAIFKCEPR